MNNIKNAKDAYEYLYSKSLEFGKDVNDIATILLYDPVFNVCSGSGTYGSHHYGDEGLIIHTAETAYLCEMVANMYSDEHSIDKIELFFSALFHDSGKMYDYIKYPDKIGNLNWNKSTHNRLIHHISRSGIIWHDVIKTNNKLYNKYHDCVLHAILSHHTSREAGSPVAPYSRVAWILTLCDNLSARIYDADTLDILKLRK